MATWATISDVALYTGAVAEESDVVKAEADISLFAGIAPVDLDPDYVTDSDIYFLKLATCWQASRHANDDDETITHDVTNISQDAFNATLTDTGAVLHPKSKWALLQLSWNKAKIVGGRPTGYGDYFNSVCASSPFPWRRM